MKPRLLEVYCGQGGFTAGAIRAGWHVTGIDLHPQPRYIGDVFTQGDAVAFLRTNLGWVRDTFQAVAGGPPCQRYSLTQRIQGNDHPDLIAATRDLFEQTGLPYVIENVEEARPELRNPVTLCGAMFGLRTYRHRLFEAGGGFTLTVPEHPEHTAPLRKMGRPPRPGDMIHAVGNFSGVGIVRDDWGVPWMNRDGIREAVPPAYGQYVGEQLMAHVMTEVSR
jgi:DNA (cytosine-5)-methyltransferase 1